MSYISWPSWPSNFPARCINPHCPICRPGHTFVSGTLTTTTNVTSTAEPRPSWHQYFLNLASVVATRATCPRKAVGCVIVRDNRILTTGYNGAVAGEVNCIDSLTDDNNHAKLSGDRGGCIVENDHCVRTVHAETNAVSEAARRGVSLDAATAYVTIKPCWTCYKLLLNAGIVNIHWGEEYGRAYPIKPRWWK